MRRKFAPHKQEAWRRRREARNRVRSDLRRYLNNRLLAEGHLTNGHVPEKVARLLGCPLPGSKREAYEILSKERDGAAIRAGMAPVIPPKATSPTARRMTKAEFDAFYDTKEWKWLRYQALLKYGRKCMCCGATDCVLHVDHIKPRSKYPELALVLSNLQILCADCNIGKGGWDQTDWRQAAKVMPKAVKPPTI